MQDGKKLRVAIFWAASCGGCEVAFVNLHEKLLDIAPLIELVFCPCLVDAKKSDVLALPDGSLDVTLFNGAIRTDENVEMAHLMRRKSKLLVAFGACAQLGGIPALSNLHSKAEHFTAIYLDNPSLENPKGTLPQTQTSVAEGALTLPAFHSRVKKLSDVVEVDYLIPGCPPEPQQIWNVLSLLLKGAALPPKGSVLGAGRSNVCNECKRIRHEERKITTLRRTWQALPDSENCLLEQGVICMGVATRDGCGGLCPTANMPCAGCYGQSEGAQNQAAKMAAALGGLLDIEPLKLTPEERIPDQVDAVLAGLPDCAGTFLRFSMAASPLCKRSTETMEETSAK